MLQKNRNSFSSGTVDHVCRHCRLEDEDILHVLACCPTFYEIRDIKKRLRKTKLKAWCSYAKYCSVFLKALVGAETLVKDLLFKDQKMR